MVKNTSASARRPGSGVSHTPPRITRPRSPSPSPSPWPAQVTSSQWLRRTVLHLGALSGHAEVVAALLESPGVNPNTEDGDGRSPLYAAAASGSPDCVALLLDAGADAEKDDMHGRTPVFVAAELGHVQVG